jgi:hypothetical protein
MLVPTVLAQGNIALTHRREGKIRGNVANFCRHGFVLLEMVARCLMTPTAAYLTEVCEESKSFNVL